MIKDNISYDFIKLRKKETLMFRISSQSNRRKITNNYEKASKEYLKAINNKECEIKSYDMIDLLVEPYFNGYRNKSHRFSCISFKHTVIDGFNNLKNILEQNFILVNPNNILIRRVHSLKIDFAFFYDEEIPLLKAKLMKFEELPVEWFSNSDVLNKKKFDALISNYINRSKLVEKVKENEIK